MLEKDAIFMKAFKLAEELSGQNLVCVIGRYPRLVWGKGYGRLRKRFFRLIELVIGHFNAGISIFRNRRRYVIVPSYTTPFLLLTYIFSLGTVKNVYLMVHHNFQVALHSPVCRFFSILYARLGYSFLLYETDEIINELGLDKHIYKSNIVVVRHPANRCEFSPSKKNRPHDAGIKIGLVGSYAPDKGQDRSLSFLVGLDNNISSFVDIIVASEKNYASSTVYSGNIIYFDTSYKDNYFFALDQCDVVLLNYDALRYKYRASGVIADAASRGCYILCPSLPVMKEQVEFPERIGRVFNDFSELRTLLESLLNGQENLPDPEHYKRYCSLRSPERSARDIVERILKVN